MPRGVAFALAAALPLYLGLNGGGYDIVVRQETGLVLWWGLALAFAFGILPRARLTGAQWLALLALAALAVWTALSLTWTESDERSFDELARVLTLAGLVVLGWAGLSATTWRAAGAGLAVAALALPLVALVSRIGPGLLPGEFAPDLTAERLSHPLNYWNGVAAWSAVAIAVGVAWSAHARRRAIRAASLAMVPVAGAALYLTYSRAGAVGAAIAVLGTLALTSQRRNVLLHAAAAGAGTLLVIAVTRSQPAIGNGTGGEGGWIVALASVLAASACGWVALSARGRSRVSARADRRVGRIAAGTSLAVGLLGMAVLAPTVASDPEGNSLDWASYPVEQRDPASRLLSLSGSRDEIWASAGRAFESEPVTGIGPGTFEFWWRRDGGEERLRDAHSLFLETLAELGLPGLAFLTAFLAALGWAALRGRGAVRRTSELGLAGALIAAFAIYLFHAAVDWMWELTAVTALGLGAATVVAAADARPRPRSRRLSVGRSGLIAVCLVAGAVQVPGIVATERIRASAFQLAIGQPADADRLADEAVRVEPWAASPYAQRALVAFTYGRFDDARSAAREAISREPSNLRHLILLARIEAESEDAAADRARPER